MKCRLIRELKHVDGYMQPAGTIIDHWQAFRLVQQGCAEPYDDDCRERAGMTPEKFAAARRAYDFLEKGIAREDWEAYERGEMTGYDLDGNWIPGPNYQEPEADPVDVAKWELLERLLG